MTSSTPSATNTRRDFLKTSTAALATASLPYWFTSATPAEAAYRSANERPVVGCIGTGSRWGGVGPQAYQPPSHWQLEGSRQNLWTGCSPRARGVGSMSQPSTPSRVRSG